MSTVSVAESGMTFGPFPVEACFLLENSATYAGIQKGVKIAEFVLVREHSTPPGLPPTLIVVEAKSSAPRESGSTLNPYLDDIAEKLQNSLHLAFACRVGRHAATEAEVPSRLRALDLRNVRCQLILVIKGCEKGEQHQLRDSLQPRLDRIRRVWALGANVVFVMDEQRAMKHGLMPPTGSTLKPTSPPVPPSGVEHPTGSVATKEPQATSVQPDSPLIRAVSDLIRHDAQSKPIRPWYAAWDGPACKSYGTKAKRLEAALEAGDLTALEGERTSGRGNIYHRRLAAYRRACIDYLNRQAGTTASAPDTPIGSNEGRSDD